MRLVVAIAIFWLIGEPTLAATPEPSAIAAAPDCGFVPRTVVQNLLSELPAEVVGLVNCYPRFPTLSAFLVARVQRSDREYVNELALHLARITVHSGTASTIVEESNDAGGVRQIWINTQRANGNAPMLHFAFTLQPKQGSTLLFFESLDKTEAGRQRSQLDKLRARFQREAWLQQIP